MAQIENERAVALWLIAPANLAARRLDGFRPGASRYFRLHQTYAKQRISNHLRTFLSSLSVVEYRWILGNQLAQSGSMTAELLATGWLVLQMTDSAFWLGAVVGVRGAAQLIFGAVGGTIADRTDPRRVLMWGQVLSALLWSVVLALVATGQIALLHVMAASATAGVLYAVTAPTSNALTYASVGQDRLLNANAFGFLTRGVFRIAAALAGGFTTAALGLPATYAVVIIASLVALVFLVPLSASGERRADDGTAIASLARGLEYSLRTPHVRALLLFSLAAELLAFPYLHMLPVIARDVFDAGAVGLGYLTAASGLGQLAGTAVLAGFGDVRRKDLLLLGSTIALGLALVLFATTRSFPLALLALLAVGAFAGVYDSAMTTLVQVVVTPEMRGRVVGALVATWSATQLGAFGVGVLATMWGAPVALAACGVIVSVNAARYLLRAIPFAPAHEAVA